MTAAPVARLQGISRSYWTDAGDVPRLAGPAELRAALASLRNDAAELQQLLQDLLLLARTDPADREAHVPVDLDDIALDVARQLRKDRADLLVDTSGITAAQIIGNARQLRRAVQNVVDNASQHARASVAFTTTEDSESCHVLIDDDGPGIPPVERTVVFERFTRLDEARSRGHGGAGLGLAIVRDIAERHRGAVCIADSPLGGARFDLSFPAAVRR